MATKTTKTSEMETYLNNLISEKDGISMDTDIEVEGPSGTNFMVLKNVVDMILIAPEYEQKEIRNVLVKIDFHNGDVMHFFNHLAKAIAL